jgi:hypothetical protein
MDGLGTICHYAVYQNTAFFSSVAFWTVLLGEAEFLVVCGCPFSFLPQQITEFCFLDWTGPSHDEDALLCGWFSLELPC